jgi:hypothetical protein
MVYFQTKNPKWGKFWWALNWIMLIFFMVIRNILQIFHGRFVNFVSIWYIFPVLVSCINKNLASLIKGLLETRRTQIKNIRPTHQGCQMVYMYILNQNTDLGKFKNV